MTNQRPALKWLTLLSPYFAAVYLAVATGGAAQDNQKAEPEFPEQFFLLDPSGSLKPLERLTAHEETRATGNYMAMAGERSNVRLSNGKDLTFVVRITGRKVDPQKLVQFFRLTQQGGQRRIQWMVGNKVTVGEAAVPFDAVKFGENSFRIKPRAELPTGEYALSLATVTSQDGFCFGIGELSPPASAPSPAATGLTGPGSSTEPLSSVSNRPVADSLPSISAIQEAIAASVGANSLSHGPSAKSETHYRTGNLMVMLKLKKMVLPVYPESAKAAGVLNGKVELGVSVSKDGKVEGAEGAGTNMLVQSAEAAVKQCEFEPMLLNGKPVAVSGSIRVIYSSNAPQPVRYEGLIITAK